MYNMLWDNKDLTEALLHKRNKSFTGEDIIRQVHVLLETDTEQRTKIRNGMKSGEVCVENHLEVSKLDASRIFHLNQIKEVCIDYRLRFLSTELYKNTIPEEALTRVKHIEKDHGTSLSGFMIMAPSSHFHLKNYDDPLLFVPIADNYYYLIHKWGNDLNPFRKLMVRPMRDMGSLLVFLVFCIALFTFVLDKWFFFGTNHELFVLLTFLFGFKAFCGVALYYCFWKGKNFNAYIWDSPYYNH